MGHILVLVVVLTKLKATYRKKREISGVLNYKTRPTADRAARSLEIVGELVHSVFPIGIRYCNGNLNKNVWKK